ncbi:MAG TPA: GAF domain-containing protein [Gaiellaceae bacterium]
MAVWGLDLDARSGDADRNESEWRAVGESNTMQGHGRGAPRRATVVVSRGNELDAILAVSRAVAEGRDVQDTLAQIAMTAARLVRARGAAIVLAAEQSQAGLAVISSYGLSPRYTEALNEIEPLEIGEGVSGTAMARGEPVLVRDVATDPLIAAWREVILAEGYRSLMSIPLGPSGIDRIGVLNVYRGRAGTWPRRDVQLLSGLADHAAIAIRIAGLLGESRQQVQSLSLVVESLRWQTHEHSNRLHAIYGLLALGEVEDAKELIARIEHGHHNSFGPAARTIQNTILAGFLLSEQQIARQSGVELRIDRRSRLEELPAKLGDLDAITLLGNLIRNAVEAVAGLAKSRRRVSLAVLDRPTEIIFKVRDWGPGASDFILLRMFDLGLSTKEGHSGIGLTIARSIVHETGGTLEVQPAPKEGLMVTVRIPR